MKNSITKIVATGFLLTTLGFAGIVNAAGASLSVSPAGATKIVDKTFDVSVGVSSLGGKVCVVEGTVSLENMSCESIAVSSGVMAQAVPTCANPYFVIGIPGCTTGSKNLFTVSVKGSVEGKASLNLLNIDVLGEGTSIDFTPASGEYTIIAGLENTDNAEVVTTGGGTAQAPETTVAGEGQVASEGTVTEGGSTTPSDIAVDGENTENVDNGQAAAAAGAGFLQSKVTRSILLLLVIAAIGYAIAKKQKKI